FDGGLATFWLSHVPRARLRAFLDGFHARLAAGAVVYLADNVYVAGVGGELLPADRAGDTYKVRRLTDGGRHRVLKNYFSTEELRTVLAPGTSELAVRAESGSGRRATAPPWSAERHGGAARSAGTERCGSPPRTSTFPPSSRQTSTSLRMPNRLAR